MCIVVEMPYRKITKQISINKLKIKTMKNLASKTNRQSVMKSYSFLNNGRIKPRSIVWKHLCATLQKYRNILSKNLKQTFQIQISLHGVHTGFSTSTPSGYYSRYAKSHRDFSLFHLLNTLKYNRRFFNVLSDADLLRFALTYRQRSHERQRIIIFNFQLLTI